MAVATAKNANATNMNWRNVMSKYMRWLASLALLVVLAACGGGGGGGGEETAQPVLPQGIWRASGTEGTVTAVVMPETAGGTVWAIGRNPLNTISLFQADLSASGQTFTGTGTAMAVPSMGAFTSTPNWVVTLAAGVPAGATMAFTLNGESALFQYDAHYDTPASLSSAEGATDWSGGWTSSRQGIGASTVVTTWRVDAAGAISGEDTSGCNFVGTFSLRAELKAVVSVQLTETCPDGLSTATNQFTGIGLPGIQGGAVVGRLLVLRRNDGQSFSVMQWSPVT